jgi:hypothetical protein
MKLISALLVSLIYSQAAIAAEWVSYSESPEGDKAFLDVESILVRGNRRIGWTKVVKAVPQDYEGGSLSSFVARVEVDCKERTQRTLFEAGYQPNGNTLYQISEPRAAMDVVPDSMGEMRLEALCKHARQKRPR